MSLNKSKFSGLKFGQKGKPITAAEMPISKIYTEKKKQKCHRKFPKFKFDPQNSNLNLFFIKSEFLGLKFGQKGKPITAAEMPISKIYTEKKKQKCHRKFSCT